jgi:ParB family chromosome partitioning protein
MKEVPVMVKEVKGKEAFEISLIENLQREDLNPIEAAEAFKHLIDEFNLSQEDLSKRIGKDRSTITNILRLLKLPSEVRNQLLQNRITSGHARAILSLEDKEKQKELCALIIKKDLSVREAEAIAKRWSEKPQKTVAPVRRRGDLESQLSSLQDSLRKYLGTKVQITQKDKKGKIEIEYYSHEDLERIVETIIGKN